MKWTSIASAVVVVFVLAGSCRTPAAQATAWLDRPLVNWNKPGAAVPRGPADPSDHDDAMERCKAKPPQTPAAVGVTSAAWVPQTYLDRELIKDDVEILAGVSGLDSKCAPKAYNLFVFVGGRYAGALSPRPMVPGTDAAAGVVRFGGDGITAEFARYQPSDSTCCPSSRVSVRYRVERPADGPVVVPLDVKTTRSY
jgi:LppP/LprE lipoprotein